MGDYEQQQQDPVQAKLDRILDLFKDMSERLAVQSVQLFGAPEDQFTAGHLPVLRKDMSDLTERVVVIEKVHAKEAGASGILLPFLRWSGSALLLAGGALLQWFMTRSR